MQPDARPFINHLLLFFEVADTGTREAKQAMAFAMGDMEDALQAPLSPSMRCSS
jgi:hypothetical protein